VRGLFVTGTDTSVGKTVLSGALLAAMKAEGESVRAYKPVVTGLDEQGQGAWPPDHQLLAAAAGMAPEVVAPLRYGPAASPHLAAALAGESIDPASLVAGAATAVAWSGSSAAPAGEDRLTSQRGEVGRSGALIVEGVGGLLTPLAEEFTVRDFAVALGLPILIAARPGLGTVNHTLLTLQAARVAELDVCAVVLTPWPEHPSRLQRSNRETIARLGAVEAETLSFVRGPDPGGLARAGAALPWRRWLEQERVG